MALRVFLFLLIVISGFVSCRNKKEIDQAKMLNQDQVNEKLLEANKATIIAENAQIDKLIFRQHWKMKETPTGLRYEYIDQGNGPKAVFGNQVRIEYEVKLIEGETVYSSGQTGPKEFRLGSGGVESGLEEGLLLMSLGDEVRFIIPSYLAHGLSGDQDKIPPKATLIYTVKLIDLQ